jgi:membrane-associated protein
MLGELIPDIDTYLLPIVAVIVALSLIPIALEWRKSRQRRAVPVDQ